jgi:hypothetical protein
MEIKIITLFIVFIDKAFLFLFSNNANILI